MGFQGRLPGPLREPGRGADTGPATPEPDSEARSPTEEEYAISNRCRLGAVVGITVLVASSRVSPVLAGPIDEKREAASRVAAQLDAQAGRITALDRQFRGTRARAEETEGALKHAEALLREANGRRHAAQGRLTQHAVSAYVHGGQVPVLEQLARSDGRDLAVRRKYLSVAAGVDRSAIDELVATREDLGLRRAQLGALRAQTETAAERLRADRAKVEEAKRGQEATLGRLHGELATLVAAEQARRDAEQARRDAEAVRRASAVRSVVHADGPGGTFACIRQLESGNNYGSPGGGAYQFTDDTWHSLGRSGTASDASPAEQDAAAVELQERRGWGQWTTAGACGR